MNFNDDIFKLIQEFIEENQHNYDSVDETVAAFMTQYQANLGNKDASNSAEAESMMLLQEAEFETNNNKRRKLLKKALKLWPENYEAEILLIDGDFTVQLEKFTQVEQRAREAWLKTDQVGWVNWEERPYWRVQHSYANFLFDIGLLTEAEKYFEESIALNEMDSLGARYNLMSIYARTYQWDKAKSLFEQIPEAANDDLMLVPMLCLAILFQRYDYASELMTDLKAVNPDLKKFFRDELMPIDFIAENNPLEEFEMQSIESLCVAFFPLIPMLFGAEYVYQWMRKEFLNKNKKKTSQKNEHKVLEFPDSKIKKSSKKLAENPKSEQSPLVAVAAKPSEILSQADLTTFEAFTKVTQAEVEAMTGIGPVTITQLKKNGVVFKK